MASSIGTQQLLSLLEDEMRATLGNRSYSRSHVTLVLGNDRGIGEADLSLEKRVGIVPDQVAALRECLRRVGLECTVIVVKGAGYRAGFSDHHYIASGAEVAGWWELEYMDPSPDVVHALKEPSGKEPIVRAPFLRIGALHTGDFSPEASYLQLIENGAAIFDGSAIGSGYRVPIRGSMSRFAGRNGAERIVRHLEKHELKGDVVVVGAGYVGRSAVEGLLKSQRVETVYLIEEASRSDFLSHLNERFAAESRVSVGASSGLDDPRLLEALRDSVGLIIGVAHKGETAPKILSVHSLAELQPDGLVIDISIDEKGAIADPTIRHGWTHKRIIPHLRNAVRRLGRHYWAIANMPRAYPAEASQVHGETVLPYLAVLLFLSALEGGPVEALQRIQRLRPGESPDPLGDDTTRRLAALTKDLRNGLAFGKRGEVVLVERIVANRQKMAGYLFERGIPFEMDLAVGDEVAFENFPEVRACLQDMLSLEVHGRLLYHPHNPADSPVTAARAVSVESKKALKCLVVEGTDGEVIAAVLPGDRQLSHRWLRDRQLLDPRRAYGKIGLPVKNVPIFSVIRRVPTFVDHSVLSLGKVIASAGHELLSVQFDAQAFRSPALGRGNLISPEGTAKANEETIRRLQRELTRAIEENDDSAARAAIDALADLFGDAAKPAAAGGGSTANRLSTMLERYEPK